MQGAEIVWQNAERCLICGRRFNEMLPKVVDHAHDKTQRIRGILCRDCNVALGLLRDDPRALRAAFDYLTRPPMLLVVVARRAKS